MPKGFQVASPEPKPAQGLSRKQPSLPAGLGQCWIETGGIKPLVWTGRQGQRCRILLERAEPRPRQLIHDTSAIEPAPPGQSVKIRRPSTSGCLPVEWMDARSWFPQATVASLRSSCSRGLDPAHASPVTPSCVMLRAPAQWPAAAEPANASIDHPKDSLAILFLPFSLHLAATIVSTDTRLCSVFLLFVFSSFILSRFRVFSFFPFSRSASSIIAATCCPGLSHHSQRLQSPPSASYLATCASNSICHDSSRRGRSPFCCVSTDSLYLIVRKRARLSSLASSSIRLSPQFLPASRQLSPSWRQQMRAMCAIY